MMAKNRENRYASAALLLEDLDSIKRGEQPLQAHKKFDAGVLAGLERGTPQEDTVLEGDLYRNSPALGLKMAVIALTGALIVAILIIILMLMNQPPR